MMRHVCRKSKGGKAPMKGPRTAGKAPAAPPVPEKRPYGASGSESASSKRARETLPSLDEVLPQLCARDKAILLAQFSEVAQDEEVSSMLDEVCRKIAARFPHFEQMAQIHWEATRPEATQPADEAEEEDEGIELPNWSDLMATEVFRDTMDLQALNQLQINFLSPYWKFPFTALFDGIPHVIQNQNSEDGYFWAEENGVPSYVSGDELTSAKGRNGKLLELWSSRPSKK